MKVGGVMNCKKCGHPLNGETVCPKCGTSIGYVVTNPISERSNATTNTSNGYVQSNTTSGYVEIGGESGIPFGVSEPTGGAFNKNYNEGYNNYNNSLVDLPQNIEAAPPIKTKKKKKHNIKEFKPIHRISEEDLMETGTPMLVNFSTVNPAENDLLARAGTKSKEELLAQMNGDVQADNNLVETETKNKGMQMELPDSKKSMLVWLIAGAVVIFLIVFGVYILPLFTDINYSKYEDEKFVIKYKKDWISQVDESSKKVTFMYKDTGYKVIINGISTFSEMNFKIESSEDRKVLYQAFYNTWKNVSGGRLTGGTETFFDLTEDNAMYAKIDYTLNNNQGVGSFYVVVCEKYDLVVSFMTYCLEKDRVNFEEAVKEFIDGIDYVGLSVEEKEQQEYASFEAGDVKSYKAGNLINYVIPESWTFDSTRTASVNNQYNIFQFKDKMSLLEIKAYAGKYTYQSMKTSAISNFGAIKSERQMTIKGKVWYVIDTPDYSSGGSSYHNELYFTMSANNNYIYYVQAYVYNETSNSSYKRKYFDDSIKYILEMMTLNNVNQ